ncbi:MAG: response regulator transcription factor [Oscillospiraceae bacterium]|jgi:DNA-binding response OmpR family regulator|nr:response regulator transcription factor [Oscillospiraceae bacterium]
MPQKTTVLLVEDDAMIASGLVYALTLEGYDAVHCASVADVRTTLARVVPRLALLDMQLPDGTGFEVQKLLTPETAVIFLTVIDDEGNIVKAFESGAEDYITKPFRLRELLARVKRVLNVRTLPETSAQLTLGAVTIDTASGKVSGAKGELLELTALEYRLLLTFAQNRGQILSRTQILENIWDSAGSFVEDNTLTVYIKRLREKLGDSVNIETVRGLGYRAD